MSQATHGGSHEAPRSSEAGGGYGAARGTGSELTKGAGLVAFAGFMVLLAGILNCIWGLAAIAGSSFFVEDTRFIIGELNSLGWVVLIVGVIQLIGGFSIFAGGEFGRWVGMIGAGLGAVVALLSLPAFPLWSVCVFALCVMILHGLSAYGGHKARV
jgi:hypothetical protein